MTRFNQEFKVQSVEKALSRRPDQILINITDHLGISFSTLQKWIQLAKDKALSETAALLVLSKKGQH